MNKWISISLANKASTLPFSFRVAMIILEFLEHVEHIWSDLNKYIFIYICDCTRFNQTDKIMEIAIYVLTSF